MDFGNEYYVRLYTRDTTTWKRLQFEGQTTLMHVLRKLDMAGVLDIEDMEPWEAVVLHCNVPEDIARRGIAVCLRLEVFVHRHNFLVAPKYREANEVSKSDRQRQAEYRERRRTTAMTENPPARDEESRPVTACHAVSTQNGTPPSRNDSKSHTRSQRVTLTNSYSNSDAGAGDRRSVTTSIVGDSPQQPAAAAESSANGEAERVSGEHVAKTWAKTISQVNPGALHAHSQWRSDFEVIAIACNAVEGKPVIAMVAVIEWFWLAPDGPVQTGRIKPVSRANPGQLAKHVSRDLDAAQTWWLKCQAAKQQHARIEVAQ